MKATKILRKKTSIEGQAGNDPSKTPITYSKRASEKKVQFAERFMNGRHDSPARPSHQHLLKPVAMLAGKCRNQLQGIDPHA